jgi:hypothetical protein
MSNDTDDPSEPSTGVLRLKHLLSKNYSIAVVALLLIAAVGAWGGYTAFVDPATQTEERTVSTWSRSGEFTHGAEVIRPNPAYTEGRRLEGRQAYFPSISPFLSGEYRVEYTASDASDVETDVELQLIVRGREDDTTFWRSVRDLNSTGTVSISPDRPRAVEYRFNMSRVQQRLERIEDTLGDIPGEPEVIVQAETRITGEINGRVVDRTYVDELRLRPDGDSFRVERVDEASDSYTRTESVRTERRYSLLWRAGSFLAVVVGIGGAGGLVALHRQESLALSPSERERLVRTEYDEWISCAKLPETFESEGEDVVELDELTGLVDVAADTGERVLYDPGRCCYVIFGARYTYVYRGADSGPESEESPREEQAEKEPDGVLGELFASPLLAPDSGGRDDDKETTETDDAEAPSDTAGAED